ncbi:MAG: hypothetical protein JSS61_07710 [Verrucomicrobia bacterium]|nr:hypothetical protein [Verrucomicrobiota bacterium]
MQWKKFVDLEKQGLRFEGLEFPNLKDLEAAAIDLARNVEGDRGVSIVVIPGGLSFAKLLTIAKKMSVRALFINDTVKPAISEIETERPYIALISNSVLNGSRRKTILELKALVQEKGYEVPLSIELLTLMVFHYKIHSKRLFSDAPWTCSLTSDRVGKRVVTVGGFSGPVDGSCHGFHINHYFGFGLEGIAPVRRF